MDAIRHLVQSLDGLCFYGSRVRLDVSPVKTPRLERPAGMQAAADSFQGGTMLLSRTARRGGREAAHHTAQMWQFRDCDSGSSIARDSRQTYHVKIVPLL